ncbi:hypothetical protein BBJ29_003641 [Phytophthora kernoviae]|uniref:PH domain-containing protein n=1 Tax=Phytophthora kernoviae TaxID=325452 RepID=A0A3F2RL39_9STRA|nr:hypothetical protein BBJ29_003641 [Phytophthora kernoviae]RLN59540.1 hypothetical protein BBP00_00006441 [Phytophthora kernoviae]
MKTLKQWKTRYCVVMGSHWLVYANQAQAISSGEAPTPVAVYELVGATCVEGDDDGSASKFQLHVVPARKVKCKARSSLERKRWVNAVEDELQIQAKTSEDLARSVKEREEKQAAREAVKTKMHEMKSDARRLSELLGEAMQSARDDSDYESDSNEEMLDDAEGGGGPTLQRYPSTAAACNPQYTCDYYEDDGYCGLTD